MQKYARTFDVALIDEAAQLIEAEACILLAVRSSSIHMIYMCIYVKLLPLCRDNAMCCGYLGVSILLNRS